MGGKSGARRIGKVRACLFRPEGARCVGFMVKRPDAAMMFHRDDLFVRVGGFVEDPLTDALVVKPDADASGKAAGNALGIDLEACILWCGMPVITQDDDFVGFVSEVAFDVQTGQVSSITLHANMAASFLLGKRRIAADKLVGYRDDVEIVSEGATGSDETLANGALVVSRDVAAAQLEGGVAEQAGKAAAVAFDKAKRVVTAEAPKLKAAAQQAGESAMSGLEKLSPKAAENVQAAGQQLGELASKGMKAASDQLTEQLGDAADAPLPEQLGVLAGKGIEAAGEQLGKTRGMFSAFVDEYKKALEDEDEEE